MNDSPNNTGLTELPPAQKAFIWYPYGTVGGVPARRQRRPHRDGGPRFLPRRFPRRGATFPAVLRRQAVHLRMDARLDHGGDHGREGRPRLDGALHAEREVQQPDRHGVRAERRPVRARVRDAAGSRATTTRGSSASSTTPATGSRSSAAAVDKPAGALPLRVALSSAGTTDLDDDALRYEWTISRPRRRRGAEADRARIRRSLSRDPGTYTASLAVTDAQGARSTAACRSSPATSRRTSTSISSGATGSFFFPGMPIRYAVRVTDREDGSLRSGTIPASRVGVTAEYLKDGSAGGRSASRGDGRASNESAKATGRG